VRPALAVVPAVAVLVAGCGHHRPTRVAADGRIGPLRVGVSDRAAVIAFAGQPDAERRGREPPHAPYVALGYDCAKRPGRRGLPLVSGDPACRTVYWLDARSNTLETFYTVSDRFVEKHGVRVGMPTAEARRLLHIRLLAGCEENIYLHTRDALLTIAFAGGILHRDTTVTGGKVQALALHWARRDAGVFDCL
jgi:hypothetical protein